MCRFILLSERVLPPSFWCWRPLHSFAGRLLVALPIPKTPMLAVSVFADIILPCYHLDKPGNFSEYSAFGSVDWK